MESGAQFQLIDVLLKHNVPVVIIDDLNADKKTPDGCPGFWVECGNPNSRLRFSLRERCRCREI